MDSGILEWIERHERLYYQFRRSRMSLCTLQIHGMAHLATATLMTGLCLAGEIDAVLTSVLQARSPTHTSTPASVTSSR